MEKTKYNGRKKRKLAKIKDITGTENDTEVPMQVKSEMDVLVRCWLLRAITRDISRDALAAAYKE